MRSPFLHIVFRCVIASSGITIMSVLRKAEYRFHDVALHEIQNHRSIVP
jgi:hypothetical protein